MDRRTFVESLSAFLLAADNRLLGQDTAFHQQVDGKSSESGERLLTLVPIPRSVGDVRNPVIDLSGDWRFSTTPPVEYWKPDLDLAAWSVVAVPSEFEMTGVKIIPNKEYPCRRSIHIPGDYANHRVFIRFDGVYGHARVWINGIFVREHSGGFTSWDCEITAHVNAGQTAELVVGITDRSDDISQASYYAKHSIAGILRDVRLFALPVVHLQSLDTVATLDSHYRDGVIHLVAGLASFDSKTARLKLSLDDNEGRPVSLQLSTISLDQRSGGTIHQIIVPDPKRWDAEHPNLYVLHMSLVVDGEVAETVSRTLGFRSVERAGNELRVNGQSVKLRGVCRHSIHPIHGRAVPAEFDETDATLFRAANVNFVRTSHYPPTEAFLDACDRHGIYVEEETAVCWSTVDGGASSNPDFADRFKSQLEEMIRRDQTHPCVLFWSLGNESQWGTNFAIEHRSVVEMDKSRPIIFSYPDTAPAGEVNFDIYSKHYADLRSDLRSSTYPILNDEYAHISCYNLETLRRDPGVRNFWGDSIRRFGEKFLTSDGCLGGSIWAGIDEVFLLPEGPVGYGMWGIIDGWRRPKPEYWLTKKAYSPIRIEDRPFPLPEQDKPLCLPIKNAFDHTNLGEVAINWAVGTDAGCLESVNIPPHGSGLLQFPSRTWKRGEILELQFHWMGLAIDQFRLPIGSLTSPTPTLPSKGASLRRNSDNLVVEGEDIVVSISLLTGLVDKATLKGQVVLVGGPYLDIGSGPLASHWLLRSCVASEKQGVISIHTIGESTFEDQTDNVPVEFEIEIDGSGTMTTHYQIRGDLPPNSQSAIAYILPSTVDKLRWNRQALWSVYPEDHIGRPTGVALKTGNHQPLVFGERPQWPWSEDTSDFFLSGQTKPPIQATNDFRSLKENIWHAECCLEGSAARVRAEANGDAAVRTAVMSDGNVSLSVYTYWHYHDLAWGNFTGDRPAPTPARQSVKMRLTDGVDE